MTQTFEDYDITQRGDVFIVRLKVESLMGMLEVTRISDDLKVMVETGVRNLVLDLKHVHYAGSAALGMFLSLLRQLKAKGGRLVLSHAENVMPLLKVSKTESMFELASDPASALERFKK